jgi:hypothetical protein
MFSRNRIERIEAIVCKAGEEATLADVDFEVSIPEGQAIHDYWREAFEGQDVDYFVTPNKEAGTTRLLLVFPEDKVNGSEFELETAWYWMNPNTEDWEIADHHLFRHVSDHIHKANGFHLLTKIVNTYGEQSPYESEHAILAKTPVRDFNALALEVNRTRGMEGDVSEELWQEAVDTLVALREQAELELTECENLNSVFENALTTEFVDDLLGGRENAAALTERTAVSLEELTKKVKAIKRVEKHLDKFRAFIERDAE